MNESKSKNFKKTILKISVSLVLAVALYVMIDKEQFVTSITHLNLLFLPLIFALVVTNYVISSVRWKKLLGIFENSSNIPLTSLIKLYFIGAFFSNFLPTSIGGDVYKAVRLGKVMNDPSKAFASTFMERFSGVVILAVFSSVGLIFTFKMLGVGLFIAFWVCALIGLKSMDLIGSKVKRLEKFVDAVKVYFTRKDILSYAFITSIFVQVCSVFTQHFIFVALGFDIPIAYSFFAFPVIILASFIIPSQNSFGVQDVLYATFFASLGITSADAVSASVIYHLVRLVISLVGGLFYALEK